MGSGDQAIAGGVGMPGLQAINRWVAKKQQVAVAVVGCRCALIAVFFDGVVGHIFRKIQHQPRGQQAEIACGREVTGFGQPLRVFVHRGFHAQLACLLVHQLDKPLNATANALSQGHGSIVTTLDDHALNKVLHWHLHLWVNKHARARHLPCAIAHRQGQFEVNFLAAQRIKNQVSSHQFGERGRFHGRVDVFLRQQLVGGDVEQQVAAGGNFWRLRHLGGCLQA